MNPLKRRLVHAGLVLFTAWPLAHVALVRHYDANPWKLGGWGMYAAPQIRAELRVTARKATWELTTRDLPEAAVPLGERFLERRLALARLATPVALGAAMLAEWPDVTAVRIEVVQPVLDPWSGRIRDDTSSYCYDRREDGLRLGSGCAQGERP